MSTNNTDNKLLCSCCGEYKLKEKDFYKSNSYTMKFNKVQYICKQCVIDLYNYYYNLFKEERMAVYYTCMRLDALFDTTAFNGAFEQSKLKDSLVISLYFQK